MDELIELFQDIIKQAGSIDVAEAEFKKRVADDEQLRALYREWCHEVGSTERNGFLDYCEEYMESQDSIWETLNDYDE
ncbi:MAG: hypothetical protein K2G30_04990 [Muribaculaceae bacterium]|nr:hypothetical protein [Muribaculaceae bacterium]